MDLTIGQEVRWHKIVSNYGHISVIPAIVRKIGKRITIEVQQEGGEGRIITVTRERLKPINSTPSSAERDRT